MIRSIMVAVGITVVILWAFSSMMNNAMADVTSNGATTNDLVNSTGSNTAITGGYDSTTTANTTYQDGSSSNTTSTSTTNNTTNAGETRVVNSATAPALSNMSQDICTIGVGIGGSSFSFSASIGTHKRDINCERLKLAKALHDMNMRVASIALLCQNPMVFEAMAHAGTSCPFLGSIGSAAEAKWKEYPKLRPDFEEYTKNLNYTTKIDDKKLEELEEEEDEKQVVSYSSGTVKLGND